MFIKQIVRCPYLIESQEVKIFFRPSQDLVTQLTLLPKLSYVELLERFSKYYSFAGEITPSQMQKLNGSLAVFTLTLKKMHKFLEVKIIYSLMLIF
jgi:hypothetical protein